MTRGYIMVKFVFYLKASQSTAGPVSEVSQHSSRWQVGDISLTLADNVKTTLTQDCGHQKQLGNINLIPKTALAEKYC